VLASEEFVADRFERRENTSEPGEKMQPATSQAAGEDRCGRPYAAMALAAARVVGSPARVLIIATCLCRAV